ncbi:hypothetical protein GGI43DRAFT_362624 [Trichoderma evansii]
MRGIAYLIDRKRQRSSLIPVTFLVAALCQQPSGELPKSRQPKTPARNHVRTKIEANAFTQMMLLLLVLFVNMHFADLVFFVLHFGWYLSAYRREDQCSPSRYKRLAVVRQTAPDFSSQCSHQRSHTHDKLRDLRGSMSRPRALSGQCVAAHLDSATR